MYVTKATLDEHGIYPGVDYMFGSVYVMCFLIGVPGNILAFWYFRSKERNLATCLYIMMNINDFMICLLSNVDMPIFFNNREPTLFVGHVCNVWINMYQLVIRMSVAITATISITRTIFLFMPLTQISKRTVIGFLLGYAGFILTSTAIPSLLGLQAGWYDKGTLCWMREAENGSRAALIWRYVDNVLDCLALVIPVLPITISCFMSVYCLLLKPRLQSTRRVKCHDHEDVMNAAKMKHHSTVTIIIITLVYLVFNVPLFIFYTLWLCGTWFSGSLTTFMGSPWIYNYPWNFVEILGVAINAAINPCLYFLRIRKFRSFLRVKHDTYVCRIRRHRTTTSQ